MSIPVYAPGKSMLIGEYAVLDGALGVVAAVNRYAAARLDDADTASAASGFISAAMDEARVELLRLGRPPAPAVPIVDTAAFAQHGRKLGLGSSAAATVAALGALFCNAGLDLSTSAVRQVLHQAARRAHDKAQGEPGSGADVLAATWGGLRTLGNGPAAPGLFADEVVLPAPLQLRFVATGRSASTATLIKRYRAVGAAAALGRERMARAAQSFIAACRAAAPGEILEAITMAWDAFMALQKALGYELLTAEHLTIAALAKQVGGVAKPSGAGGGDLAIVFLPDSAAAAALEQRLLQSTSSLENSQMELLPLRISPYGVHVGALQR